MTQKTSSPKSDYWDIKALSVQYYRVVFEEPVDVETATELFLYQEYYDIIDEDLDCHEKVLQAKPLSSINEDEED